MSESAERARVAALCPDDVLDAAVEPGLKDFVTLATQICDAPLGLVSLVVDDHRGFEARIGIDARQAPLFRSVCAQVLDQADGLLIIPDLTQDVRTSDNTLVTGAPFLRFYAGAALRTPEDIPRGTLCVIDGKPRPDGLTLRQISGLRALARQVLTQLELRRVISGRDEALAAAQAAQRALEVSAERYRLSTRATTDLIWDWDRATQRVYWDEAITTVYGYRPDEVEPTAAWWDGRIHSEDRERIRESIVAAIEGTGTRWTDTCRFRRANGSHATVLNRAIVARDEAGRATRITGVMLDITDRVDADAREDLLKQELSHRMKNILAMVQAITSQTLRNAPDLDTAREALLQRLSALGRAHDLLLTGEAERAGLEAVVRRTLALHDDAQDGRLQISGPPVEIGPKAALALALMVHELATNAAKFGALSREPGRVIISWQIENGAEIPQLQLCWIEEGGPPVVPPTRKGFGTRLISRVLAGTIGGEVTLAYRPTGLRCDLVAPLAGFREDTEALRDR